MTNQNTRQCILALHYVQQLSLHKYKRLIAAIGHIKNLATTSPQQLSLILNTSVHNATALKVNYLRMLETPLEQSYFQEQIIPILYSDDRYPAALQQLMDPPLILYTKGDNTLLTTKKIAIIGSRKATSYSQLAMDLIVPPLIEHEMTIVSGLAQGADSLAHATAMKYGGKTIGVLGHGFFHCYPKANQHLMQQMATQQLLVTEYPPYVGPKKWHFPMRNRIISGLSEALVVTEASTPSGTLITTEHALEHGKDVFVVPGPIHSEQSTGTNKLIKEGAIVIWNGYQIIEEMRMFSW